MLKTVAGLYKRAGRKEFEFALTVHAEYVVEDARGKAVAYYFGIRTDAAAAGQVQSLRQANVVPTTLALGEADEAPMSLEGWYLNPKEMADFLAPVEKITDPRLVAFAVGNGSKPLAEFVA